MAPSIDIVLVNWNSGGDLQACLATAARIQREEFVPRFLVVDNASGDGSVERLDGCGLPVTVIRNARNVGFAAACNQAARGSTADYLLFLNPDTRLRDNSLAVPIRFMQAHADVGIAGIRLVDETGQITRSCARTPTPGRFTSRMLGLDRGQPPLARSHRMTDWDHAESREVDHVIGAFYLVRRSVFESLGGFDERFFVYLEDIDFSVRARQAGWRCWYLTETRAVHRGGSTAAEITAARLCYALRSRIRYGYKHFNWCAATSLMLGTLLIEPGLRVLAALGNRSGGQLRETLNGFAMLWRNPGYRS